MIKHVIKKSELKKLLSGKLYRKYKRMRLSYLVQILALLMIMFFIVSILFINKMISFQFISSYCFITSLLFLLLCCKFIHFKFGTGECMLEQRIAEYLTLHNESLIAMVVSDSDVIDERCVRPSVHDKVSYMYLEPCEMEKVKLENQIILHHGYVVDGGRIMEIYWKE